MLLILGVAIFVLDHYRSAGLVLALTCNFSPVRCLLAAANASCFTWPDGNFAASCFPAGVFASCDLKLGSRPDGSGVLVLDLTLIFAQQKLKATCAHVLVT